jgi:OPA family sugar phosphate sensor protein UhpC-like MFS transporter
LTHWYSQKERGRWWSVLNTSLSVGGGAIPFLAAWCISCSGWRFALYVPGVLCIGMGLVLMNRLRDVPQTLGLPPIEQFKRDVSSSKSTAQPKASVKEILFSSVFNNRF